MWWADKPLRIMQKVRALAASCLLPLLANAVLAKDWRRIFPLYATRPYVTSLLGKPDTDYGHFSMYYVDEDVVAFEYADKYCDDSQFPSRYNVSKDTVLTITILPSKIPSLSEYQIPNMEKLRKEEPDSNSFVYYFDDELGISYSVKDNKVFTITYGPPVLDAYLRCQP
jgi:hypothetical protein